MTIDKRFCLIADNGDLLYPYVKEARDGRRGFALTEPGQRDARGEGHYTEDLEEVIRRVVQDGWKVRARTEKKAECRARDGSFCLGQRAIHDFRVDPSLAHLLNHLRPISSTDAGGFVGHDEYEDPDIQEALRKVDSLTAEQYVAAYRQVEPKLTEAQRTMLQSHAAAADASRSMEQLAIAAGYSGYEAANIQYGKMAGLIAEALGINGLPQKTMALAETAGQPARGEHWRWKLRPAFLQALRDVGLIDSSEVWLRDAAQASFEADPQAQGVDATTRQTLVEARVGQGTYRQELMNLWSGRCAVSGIDIPEVLIASHIKAWSRSNNLERLDPYNGLLLAANIDKLFDKGLISFDNEGQLLVSEALRSQNLAALGLAPGSRLRQLHPKLQAYLVDHRQFHGFSRD
ncbi:HNH endonuclease [Aquabacterium sp.]|uniref:HNH endonuclease n=1 Tax=Aquabacterium sp. TaxID=1872578 RepID=UPI002E3662E4|nr:HNH endonuclease [Aquabacterium sp.]HEX5311984.1 HNH endonuclease [Aquabacterium sp.]